MESAVAPVVSDFAAEVSNRLGRLVALAADGGLDTAVGLMTRAIEAGAVIQAFGTGHSEAFAMEIAGRAGSHPDEQDCPARPGAARQPRGGFPGGIQPRTTPTPLLSCGRSHRSTPETSS